MLGNEHYPGRETESSNEDSVDSLTESVPYMDLFLDTVIGAAISQTGDDMLEKIMKLNDSLGGKPRLHTAEDVEIAIDESVDKIMAGERTARNAGVSGPVPEEILIHGYTRRGLEVLAACRGLSVESVIDMLERSAEQQEYDPIVQIIRDRSWVDIRRWLDEWDLERSRDKQPRLQRTAPGPLPGRSV